MKTKELANALRQRLIARGMLQEDLKRYADEKVLDFFNVEFSLSEGYQPIHEMRKVSEHTLGLIVARAASVDDFIARMSQVRPEILPEPPKPVHAKPSRQAMVKAIAKSLRHT